MTQDLGSFVCVQGREAVRANLQRSATTTDNGRRIVTFCSTHVAIVALETLDTSDSDSSFEDEPIDPILALYGRVFNKNPRDPLERELIKELAGSDLEDASEGFVSDEEHENRLVDENPIWDEENQLQGIHFDL